MSGRTLDSPVAQSLMNAMQFRCIGPPRGGRSVAVAAHPTEKATFYFGAVAGGIWKTEDAGTTWHNISDGYLATSSVGALAVSESDPNVIYAGMGESTIRIDVSHGDGIYRSGDGGQTWVHKGLSDTRHIGEIRIHPKNPDIVFVAALGHAFGTNEQRGIFKSTDGGDTWEHVLHKSDGAGAVDISFDPRHPEVIYASIWETHRNFWELSSGGPDSGLWKSTDGGDTWVDITRNKGLPQDAIIGKIGVTASPVKSGRVWALIEASKGPGLYRSDDFGESWSLVNEETKLRFRPWYYMHVFADTQDADTVYVNNLMMWRSHDGGRTFDRIGTPHGDNHDLWIDPNDNQRMVQANDGGANVSFNAGDSWSTIYNQLTAQFYTVTTDNREPFYHVYGTQQDNSSIAVPSGANDGAITWADCYAAGSGESGFVAVHPDDHNIVFVGAVGSSPGGGGALQRYNHRSGQIQLVNVYPEAHGGIGPGALKYRFPWTFPILFSPHDSGVLYTAGNVVFRTTDEGLSWEAISPDLSRNDPEKLQASGGPITKDTSGAEHYCTVATLRECSLEPGVMWAGSDDGLVHMTRDGGETWNNVTPPDVPDWAFIRTVEPSPHAAGTVYVAATKYKLDDYRPYLYRTNDYGETWEDITGSGIPEDDFVRVIRCDPEVEGLLYVGTETGLYVSHDDGATWTHWDSNLPVTPIYDIEVKGSDLVLGTHGRSFWIMDDLTPLRQILTGDDEPTLFQPRAAWRVLPDLFWQWITTEGKDYWVSLGKTATFEASLDETGQVKREFVDAGESAPAGAMIYYHLAKEPGEVQLEILDAGGSLIRAFGTKPEGYDDLSDDKKGASPGPWITVNPGVNRFVWDLRYDGSTRVPGNKLAGEANVGPMVAPGTYQVRLTVGEHAESAEFEVVNDPRSEVTQEALEQQLEALLAIRDKISEAHEGVNKLRSVRSQLQAWRDRPDIGSTESDSATSLMEKLDEVEAELIVPGDHSDTFGLNERARLNEKLSSVISIISSADSRPTTQAIAVAEQYSSEIDQQLEALDGLLGPELDSFNEKMKAAELPAITI